VSRYFRNRATGQSKKLRTRAELFDSALAMFYQGGISTVRLEDITRHAGMANATFYNHFKDKDALILDLSTTIICELMAAFDEAVTEIENAPVRMVVLMHVMMNRILERESWGWFLAQSFYWVPRKPDFGASDRLKAEVELGVEQGSFSDVSDRFQLDQVSSVLVSGIRQLDKGDANIVERTSENILKLLGMSQVNAGAAVVKAQAFL
jgi:AcrR family transcriptional regulator